MIAGIKVQNVAVEVYFGKHHPVDSSEAAFKTAGSMAFRNVFREPGPALLEPIVKLHVTVPGEKLGTSTATCRAAAAGCRGMDSAGGDLQTVTAEVPLAEVTTYARSLSSMTGGQGSYTMEFSHYDVVPPHVQKEIIEKAVLQEEEEALEPKRGTRERRVMTWGKIIFRRPSRPPWVCAFNPSPCQGDGRVRVDTQTRAFDAVAADLTHLQAVLSIIAATLWSESPSLVSPLTGRGTCCLA